MWEGSLLSTPSPAFIICRLFSDGHSDQCEVVPPCSFDMHFPNNYRWWASFRVPAGHLHELMILDCIQPRLSASLLCARHCTWEWRSIFYGISGSKVNAWRENNTQSTLPLKIPSTADKVRSRSLKTSRFFLRRWSRLAFLGWAPGDVVGFWVGRLCVKNTSLIQEWLSVRYGAPSGRGFVAESDWGNREFPPAPSTQQDFTEWCDGFVSLLLPPSLSRYVSCQEHTEYVSVMVCTAWFYWW